MKHDVTFCTHYGCYEDCELNINNADDDSLFLSLSDRYHEGCPLYNLEHGVDSSVRRIDE